MQVSLVSLVTQITLETFSPALYKSTEKINTSPKTYALAS